MFKMFEVICDHKKHIDHRFSSENCKLLKNFNFEDQKYTQVFIKSVTEGTFKKYKEHYLFLSANCAQCDVNVNRENMLDRFASELDISNLQCLKRILIRV